ncbi:hypothetical protein Cni_G15764 [Canna indica]|uniref:Hydroxyproline-rich glycoprotein family protein n=1 Tax=Canna indica TaxID=4628 RepID=A0AAQ3KDZ1_9LILI|nr:hypothetical protein Cni_G15764 [Canna indica]
MADSNSSPYLSKLSAQTLRAPSLIIQQLSQKFSSNFLHKAICFSVVIALLSLFPSQATENQSVLTRTWELLHLLFVGIAISYGLFSRRNLDFDAGKETSVKADNSPSYLSDMLQVSSVFNHDDFCSFHGALTETKTQTWSSQYHRNDPVVVIANEGTRRPLLLPVRSLKSHIQDLDSGEEIVESSDVTHVQSSDSQMMKMEDEQEPSRGILFAPPSASSSSSSSSSSSPLPSPAWNGDSSPVKTSSFRPSKTSSFRSSKTPSPKRPSYSRELRAKSSEDLSYTKTFYDLTPPPAPPPPPPFASHGNSSIVERKIAQRSFKDELKDLSRRVRKGGQCNTDIVFDLFESAAKLNRSSVGRSCRTFRPRDVQGGAVDGETNIDSEKAWGYEANQPESLPKFHSKEKNEVMEEVAAPAAAVDSHKDEDDEEEEGKEEKSSVEEEVLQSAAKGRGNENEVDKKADEFIAKFRKQMTLQRFEAAKC